jgi:chondroitin AC lyase
MLRIIFGFNCLLVSSIVLGQADNTITKFPVIKFEVDTTDLGVIDSGDIIEFDINFINSGEADLNIEVVTACKCIDIDWPRDAIQPGKKGSIKVVFDSAGIPKGKAHKTIDIISNTNPIVVEAFMKTWIQ